MIIQLYNLGRSLFILQFKVSGCLNSEFQTVKVISQVSRGPRGPGGAGGPGGPGVPGLGPTFLP